MNLCFILLILLTASNGCFCRRASHKRSVRKVSVAAKPTNFRHFADFASHFVQVVALPYPNSTNSTSSSSNYPTAEKKSTHPGSNSTNSTSFLSNFLTPEIDWNHLESHFLNFNKIHSNFSTTATDFKRSSKGPANVTAFFSNFLAPQTSNSHNFAENLTTVGAKPSNDSTIREDAELSGIIIYEPTIEDRLFPQQSLMRKFQKILVSLFSGLEQSGLANQVNNDYNRSAVDHNKVKRDEIGDFLKRAKDALVESSNEAIKTTKDAVKTIESHVKKIVTRNSSLTQNESANEKNSTLAVGSSTAMYENNTNMSTVLSYSNDVESKSTLGEIKELNGNTQPAKKEMPSAVQNLIPTPSEPLINPQTIDKHTKYFFGEGSTDINTADTTLRTIKEETTDVTSTETIKPELHLKHKSDHLHIFSKNSSQVKCMEKEHCFGETEEKQDPTKNFELQITNLQASKPKASTVPRTSSSSKPATTSKKSISTVDHSEATHAGGFKMDMREDFFKYNDWLWQHLEAARNGSLKPNATEEFLKKHHFLLNSGGTGKSATAASEFFSDLFKMNSTPEEKPYHYQLVLEQHKQNMEDFPPQRHMRIKRGGKKGTRRKPKKKSRKQTTEQEIKTEAITLEDVEVTLPEGETELPTTTTTDKIKKSTGKTDAATTVVTSKSETPTKSRTTGEPIVTRSTTKPTLFVRVITQPILKSVPETNDADLQSKITASTQKGSLTALQETTLTDTQDTASTTTLETTLTTTQDTTLTATQDTTLTATQDTTLTSTLETTLTATQDTTLTPTLKTTLTDTQETTLIATQETTLNATKMKARGGTFTVQERQTSTKKDTQEPITTTVIPRSTTKRHRVSHNLEEEYNDGGGIRTKPLLLLVTIPSFLGIGIFILLLCYITRNGGWCCQLFDTRRVSVSISKDSPPATPRSRTLYY